MHAFLGPHSFTFVYGFQSGYLERLKEQLNEVKTVRVPVTLSRLISMPFFSTVPPELRPEIRLVLFQRCVTGLFRALLEYTRPTQQPTHTADTVMSRRYFNCRLKATLSPWCENSSWNRVKYEGTWRLANNLPGSGISNFKFADLNFSSGERFRSFSDASRSNVLLQRATNLLFFPRMDNHFCFFFIILDVNFNFEVKKKLSFLLFYIF